MELLKMEKNTQPVENDVCICRFVLIIKTLLVFLRTPSVNSIPLFKMSSRREVSSSTKTSTRGVHIIVLVGMENVTSSSHRYK